MFMYIYLNVFPEGHVNYIHQHSREWKVFTCVQVRWRYMGWFLRLAFRECWSSETAQWFSEERKWNLESRCRWKHPEVLAIALFLSISEVSVHPHTFHGSPNSPNCVSELRLPTLSTLLLPELQRLNLWLAIIVWTLDSVSECLWSACYLSIKGTVHTGHFMHITEYVVDTVTPQSSPNYVEVQPWRYTFE